MFKYFMILAAGVIYFNIISCSNSQIKDNESGSEDFFAADTVMPEPIGGVEAIQSKVIYPLEVKKEGIEGKVYVIAFINEDGQVVKTKVVKGVHPLLDESASNAIRQTKFKPGKINGKPVKVQVMVPIVFILE